MKDLKKIEVLVNELFIGFTAWFKEKERVKNWSVYSHAGQVFVKYNQAICYSEKLAFDTNNHQYYLPVTTSIVQVGADFINKNMGLSFAEVSFSLHNLKHRQINNVNLLLYFDDSEFTIKMSPFPDSWVKYNHGNEIDSPVTGLVIHLNDPIYNMSWALKLLNDIQNELNAISEVSKPGIKNVDMEEAQTEKALNELRNLLR